MKPKRTWDGKKSGGLEWLSPHILVGSIPDVLFESTEWADKRVLMGRWLSRG